MRPQWNELGFLAAPAGLRTALSVSLTWTLKESQEEEQKVQRATMTTDTPAGPGPFHLDPGSRGPKTDFTNPEDR